MTGAWPIVALGLCAGLAAGCAEGPRFVQLDERGGTVVYPLKKDRDSVHASPFRAEALTMIEAHCDGPYLITRDGETASQARNTGRDADDPVTVRRYWGMRFSCKERQPSPAR